MCAADFVAPSVAYPPDERQPTTDIKLLARSKCRRRRRGASPGRRHFSRRGPFAGPVAGACVQNRLWFDPTNRFRVGRYMAHRRSFDSKKIS